MRVVDPRAFTDPETTGSPAVSFDLTFRLERTQASNRPIDTGITASVILNKSGGGTITLTGSSAPSLFNTPAYVHDEASSAEALETVDRGSIATFRFTITPNGQMNYISSLDFVFGCQVLATPSGQAQTTPESYAIDDLRVMEVYP